MGDVLGYARVSTGDQDVAGQTMRLERAGAIRVFTDVKSGKSMDRPGLIELLAYARKGDSRRWVHGSGFVTRFEVRRDYLARCEVREADGKAHLEYWIPAQDLPDFKRAIVGKIEVVHEFR
jgi:hypothetical protein